MSSKVHLLPKRVICAALILSVLSLLLMPAVLGDHRDGPIFENGAARLDIGELYVFRSPANANNTVLVMTVSPFAGGPGGTPSTFQENAIYDFKIATSDPINASDDITFRVTFSAPDGLNAQDVTLRVLPGAKYAGTGILAKGKTNTNLPVVGGGQFRAGVQDDPYFFDETGFRGFLNGVAFPRSPGVATNRYGPNANILAITLEIPSVKLGPNTSIIGIWCRTELGTVQQDRAARPYINEGLIPPVPRGSNFPIGVGGQNRQERRNAFNAGHPRNDRVDFKSDMVSVLQNFYLRTPADSNAIADLFLPDLLFFQIGNPNGFGTFINGAGVSGSVLGNGRRLADDVIDVTLNIMTNGAIPTDNVGDDNALRLTDGSVDPVSGMTRAIAFPYIGAPNAAPTGP